MQGNQPIHSESTGGIRATYKLSEPGYSNEYRMFLRYSLQSRSSEIKHSKVRASFQAARRLKYV